MSGDIKYNVKSMIRTLEHISPLASFKGYDSPFSFILNIFEVEKAITPFFIFFSKNLT